MTRIRLSSKVKIPQSVADMQKAYKKAATGLVGKAYTGQIVSRYKSLKKDFKIKKAFDLVFTVLGLKIPSDYLASRRALRAKLETIGHVLSAEAARDPKLRSALKNISSEYPYLSVNKNGEIFVSSFSGSVFDKKTLVGMVMNPENAIPSRKYMHESKQAFGQRLDLKLVLKMGSPQYESATITSRTTKARAPSTSSVFVAARGSNEIRVFSRKTVAGKITSAERIIKGNTVTSKKLMDSANPDKKILLLRVKTTGNARKNIELVRIEIDAKKAQSIFDSFKPTGE